MYVSLSSCFVWEFTARFKIMFYNYVIHAKGFTVSLLWQRVQAEWTKQIFKTTRLQFLVSHRS
jgi:hypothetical protein